MDDVPQLSLFWFRRDLRLEDNTGLYHALKENESVLPVFIFDTNILRNLEDKYDARVSFIHEIIFGIKARLEKQGSSLLMLYGNPIEVFSQLVSRYNITSVYCNHDYEPYARERDREVAQFLKSRGIVFKTFKDQVVFEKDELVKKDGNPYTVYTPYMHKWKSLIKNSDLKIYSTQNLFGRLSRVHPLSELTLNQIGFNRTNIPIPSGRIPISIISKYDKTRDFPYLNGTTRLGIHLRFGTISIRELVKKGMKLNEKWLEELIWREFFMMILWHFPHVEKKCFKSQYENIRWRNDETEFTAWCEGKTGFPFVDAGMRQLNSTGFMHNRLRMLTASFLTKHLLIDWRWGESYFASRLLDYEMASNVGGWQWAAGCGCDAVPYFRIFNPETQLKKFDPQLEFVKKWIPELGTKNYPNPIVEHSVARERALKEYKMAL